MTHFALSRRTAVTAMTLSLGGCLGRQPSTLGSADQIKAAIPANLAELYAALPNERHPVPAVDFNQVDEKVLRRIVANETGEAAGTIVIETSQHALFLVLEGGSALRYGVGVGREGLAWSGRATVGRKAEWPRWTPTAAMIAREPERNGPWANGMEPGIGNPLGARALYLYRSGRDTMYRIHGTNEPWSIGQSVSSGCIRMINQDVIDLFGRVPLGTPVVVRV